MANILDKIIDFFFDKKGNQRENNFDDTATRADIDCSEFREEEVDYSDYWWCFQASELEEVPMFEDIDPEVISKELNKKIDDDEFPVIEIPSNVMKIMNILNNIDFEYNEVANMINHSPAMSGEFLKVTNSSLYSRGNKISTLSAALPRLGKDNVKAILYMYSSKMSFSGNPLFNELATQIIEHSYATALIASFLSQRFFPNHDLAFLAGLLHNIGKLGILKALPDLYDFPTTVDFELTEKTFENIFNNVYEKAGVCLAKNWDIDETVINAIEHHNDYFQVGTPDDLSLHLSAIVNVSSTMARMLGKGQVLEIDLDVFSLPATIELAIERDKDTLALFDDIPKVLNYKMESS